MVHFTTGTTGTGLLGMGLRFVTLDEPTRAFLESAQGLAAADGKSLPPLPAGVGEASFAVPRPPRRPLRPRPPTVSPAAPKLGAPAAAPSAPAEESTEEPKRTGPIIGIDLGTTNSCAASCAGQARGAREPRGANTVPSILALNARNSVVGHPAKGQILTNPRQTVYGSKRLVGRSFESPSCAPSSDRFAYEIAPGPRARRRCGWEIASTACSRSPR